MTYSQVCDEVVDLLSKVLDADPGEIRPASKLKRDLNVDDEMQYVDITWRLEQEFGVKIDADELFPCSNSTLLGDVTPEAIALYVWQHLAEPVAIVQATT